MQANRFKGSFVSSGTTGGDIGQKPLIVAAKQPAAQQSLPPPPPAFLMKKAGPSAAESATAAAVSCSLSGAPAAMPATLALALYYASLDRDKVRVRYFMCAASEMPCLPRRLSQQRRALLPG